MSKDKMILYGSLKWKVVGGGLEDPESITLSKRFLGNTLIPITGLSIGDLATKTEKHGETVYEVVNPRNGIRVEVRAIGWLEYNQVLREHREKQSRGEIPDAGLDPEGSRISISFV